MDVKVGEIYGKRSSGRIAMYNVLKVTERTITLQNIDNPLSLFETTPEKLRASGYTCISQIPYVNTTPFGKNRRVSARRPHRCPYTLDFLEGRADCEKPQVELL